MYSGEKIMAFTGATIEPRDVYFHPPRRLGFRVLQWAPWPAASPGLKGTTHSELVLGEGWGEREGQRISKILRDIGVVSIKVPAGGFADAWYVEGTSPNWSGRFWWVPRVGFVRMIFKANDGRRIELVLLDVRSTAS